MQPKIVKADSLVEAQTYERCSIAENYSAPDISIARARVKPGETTVWHHLEGVQEVYLVTEGYGKVEVGSLKAEDVGKGDVVVIPPGVSQRIQLCIDIANIPECPEQAVDSSLFYNFSLDMAVVFTS